MFFKKALPIIYKDVISSITSFFSFSQFWCYLQRHELYSYHLVPKVPNHTLCKCIFPNRLTSLLLPSVIDLAQSDIVSGKRIAVNIWTRFIFYTHISVTECIDIESINYHTSPLAAQPLDIISGQHFAMNWKRLPEYVVCNHSIKWPQWVETAEKSSNVPLFVLALAIVFLFQSWRSEASTNSH